MFKKPQGFAGLFLKEETDSPHVSHKQIPADHSTVWHRKSTSSTDQHPWTKVDSMADDAQTAYSHAKSKAGQGGGHWAVGNHEKPTHLVNHGSKMVYKLKGH